MFLEGRLLAKFLSVIIASTVFSLTGARAFAEDGVSPKEILIGIVNDQSGPSDSAVNKHYNAAAALVFDKVNKAGGVNGRSIRTIMYDDVYEPEKTANLTKKALEVDKVFMLMNYGGTPTTKAAVPAIEKSGVPFLFPRTGDPTLRVFRHSIFNLRGSFDDELLATMKEVVVKRGLHKVAIVAQADGFGSTIKSAVLAAYSTLGLMQEVRERGSAFVAEAAPQRNSKDMTEPFKKIAASNPEVVVLAVPPGQAVAFIKMAAAEHKTWQMVATSSSSSIQSQLEGGVGEGTLISQAMPILETSDLAVVKQFRAEMTAAGLKEHINGTGFEGYLNALVAVDGLKKAGKDLTREGLIKAFESNVFEMGGLNVHFTPQSHNAGLPVAIDTIKKH